MLVECIDYHARPNAADPLREIRARAERAAVNLFFAAAAGLSRIPSLRKRLLEEENVKSALREADHDLQRCLELEKVVEAEVLDSDERDRIFPRLQRQILSNISACAVIQAVLFNGAMSRSLTASTLAQRAMSLLEREDESIPQVVRGDLLMFPYLIHYQSRIEPEIVAQLAIRTRSPTILALDHARLEASMAWIKAELTQSGILEQPPVVGL
jgi:hypothetical protein